MTINDRKNVIGMVLCSFALNLLVVTWQIAEQVSQLKQGLADRTAKTAVSVAI